MTARITGEARQPQDRRHLLRRGSRYAVNPFALSLWQLRRLDARLYDRRVVIDWGDVPTWLASLFGAGAFLGALLLFRVEAGRDKRQKDLDEQAQAELITAWIKRKPGYNALQLGIQNASKSCAFELYVSYGVRNKVFGYELYDVVIPQDEAATHDVPIEMIRADHAYYLSNGYSGNLRPTIYFRDGANRRWKRDYDGYLTRISGNDGGYRAAVEWFSGEVSKYERQHADETTDEFLREYGKRVATGDDDAHEV